MALLCPSPLGDPLTSSAASTGVPPLISRYTGSDGPQPHHMAARTGSQLSCGVGQPGDDPQSQFLGEPPANRPADPLALLN